MTSIDFLETQVLTKVNVPRVDRESRQQQIRKDAIALIIPLTLLIIEAVGILKTGTIPYITDPHDPRYKIGDLYRYINMALPNANYQLSHEPPFLYRVLVPMIVHGLIFLGIPFQTGFFAVTSLALAISTIGIFYLVRGCNVSRVEAACATLGYLTIHWAVAYNFNDFYLIDASAQAFIILILLAVQRQRFTTAIILAVIGVVCNERIYMAVAVGVIQLILPYIRPLPRTAGLLLRAQVGRVWRSAPRLVWLQLAAFIALPIIASVIVRVIQQPYYPTQLLTEMGEYIPTHFRYGAQSLYTDYNGGTIYTYGSLYFTALTALILGIWERTKFSLWAYFAAFLVILFSFTLSSDLQRLTVIGWPFIIMLSAVAIHTVARTLRIAPVWLWAIVLAGSLSFQLSITLQLVPLELHRLFTLHGFQGMIWATFAFMMLTVMAVLRMQSAPASVQPAFAYANAGAATDAEDEPDDFEMLKTAKRAAVLPRETTPIPSDPDGIFWMQARGGLAALAAHDQWKAEQRLRSLEGALPAPLQLAPWVAPPTSALVALWQRYLTVINAYQGMRQQMRLPVSPVPMVERAALAALNTAQQRVNDPRLVVSTRRLSIVLPAYNEEAIIGGTIWDCLRLTQHFCPNVEVIVVNDGSRDATGAIINEWAARDARVRAVDLVPNQGYGGALMAGFNAAEGEWIFFMDSDGQFDINQLSDLVALSESHPHSAILGYRKQRNDPPIRKLNAWGWKQLTHLLLGLHGVRDIDCAFKLLPAQAVHACQIQTRGAMINTEMLIKFQRMGVPLLQVPVNHFPRTHGKATGANLRVIANALRELLQLRSRIKHWQPTPLA
ncbi:MAG: glycosyltransferase family 2 protein [Ktedonobacterales bacterium]|nr:glycosyltransferase family 2 protein [Ktedonobacterales bacterium]